MRVLDKKDQKLLLELHIDGRASLTELASRTGISKEVAHYRLKKLQTDGILTKMMLITDLSAIGYSTSRVQILLNKDGKIKKSELEEEFKNIKNLSWLVKLSGQWDYALLFSTKQTSDFPEIYDKFISKYGKYIDKKLFSTVHTITHFFPTHIIGGKRTSLVQKIKQKSFELDENQKKIINLLEEDGRMPLLEMAKKLNVSVSTIKYHMQVLDKKKIIIGYKPILNIDLLGYEHFKVMLELSDPSEKNKLRELLSNNPNVIYITDSLGKYDLEFECNYENMHRLLAELSVIESQISIRKYDIIFTNEEIIINGMPED